MAFLAPTTDVPKRVHLRVLEAAAAIEDQGWLDIAKFQSPLETEPVGAGRRPGGISRRRVSGRW